ncbi:MAG TPA: protein phosphatase CheZ [Gallionella sp.]|nr:protein phosphatase CheZ [Gallionella sp.]
MNKSNDEDLELLFESILANNKPAATDPIEAAPTRLINQLGQITRTLHDTLRELGLNAHIEQVASSIPDARDRLNYVATLTQQAAERVLNATEAAQPLVQNLEAESQQLDQQWDLLLAGKLSPEEFKALVMHNKAFLQALPEKTSTANAYLIEIMMAQDFQDLTGQVIKKIIDLTQNMERQLLGLLLENSPAEDRSEPDTSLENGPVINQNNHNVVTNQDQVDDLLESLGF